MKKPTRRKFMQQTSAAGLGLVTAASTRRILGANERVRIGLIGVGSRGDQVLDAFLMHPDAQIISICDVYQPYLPFAARKAGGSPALHRDYRKILEQKDVDAVVVATPDHWHALQMIQACEAGKDVYVEKPLALTIAEGRKMVDTARRTQRVVQVGIQRRSSKFVKEAADFIRSGGIGHVTVAKCYHVLNETPLGIGNPPDSAPPEGLDWDLWLGPAPKVPYNENRCAYKFRWFWDYSGGQLTNFGTHYLDNIQWALGETAPLTVTALGGKFGLKDNREIPDTLEVLWKYKTGTLVVFSQYNCNAAPCNISTGEVEFRGTKGTLYLGLRGYEVIPEVVRDVPVPARSPLDRRRLGPGKKLIEPIKVQGGILDADHARNFLDCVRSRKTCNCDIETGHRSTSAALLGNIALRTNSVIEWDSANERVTNHSKANDLLSYRYRSPWRLA
ncbi:MAG: Gfo/Idh/MocA family oxidoreductase [Acidobacteria bacterium]|nr:Gfo/Idh/MocA family oxidoreductase [Acidobacteriota bacterium]MCI0722782.1 Gfo/Idh/MocA family oxidoreductase [Acidobacteriota bacterium]